MKTTKEKVIEVCKNLSRTINTMKITPCNSFSSKQVLKRKLSKLMEKHDLKNNDL
jgi:hypothetical protein